MAIQFNIQDLYMKAFGVKAPEYDLKETNEGLIAPNNYSSVNPDVEPKSKYGSSPYFKQDALGRYYFMPVKLGDLDLPYPIIRIQSRKNIVETQMTERKGSVIEIISQDNWKIYIRGFIFAHDRKFPEEDIYNMRKMYERNESLVISSVLTDLFLTSQDSNNNETDKVVITDINFPEVKGIEHVKPYEIQLISDSIFELEV